MKVIRYIATPSDKFDKLIFESTSKEDDEFILALAQFWHNDKLNPIHDWKDLSMWLRRDNVSGVFKVLTENQRLKNEVAHWKARAAKHGCNIEQGDPDCG